MKRASRVFLLTTLAIASLPVAAPRAIAMFRRPCRQRRLRQRSLGNVGNPGCRDLLAAEDLADGLPRIAAKRSEVPLSQPADSEPVAPDPRRRAAGRGCTTTSASAATTSAWLIKTGGSLQDPASNECCGRPIGAAALGFSSPDFYAGSCPAPHGGKSAMCGPDPSSVLCKHNICGPRAVRSTDRGFKTRRLGLRSGDFVPQMGDADEENPKRKIDENKPQQYLAGFFPIAGVVHGERMSHLTLLTRTPQVPFWA